MIIKGWRRWLFGGEQKDKTNDSWPTAQERVAAAREVQGNGNTILSTRSSSSQKSNNNPILLVCPMVAKEVLQQHEDCRRFASSNHTNKDVSDDDDSDNDSQEEDDDDDDDDHPKTKVTSQNTITTRLHKPVKPNRLLQHALTNANGDNWRRQRPLVQRALGDALIVRDVAVPSSVRAALRIIDTKLNNTKTTKLEVRSFAEQVAVATMIASVFGTNLQESDPESYQELTHAISNLFRPTLLPIRGDEARAVALGTPVRRLVTQLLVGVSASLDPNTVDTATTTTDLDNHNGIKPCLATNLLEKHGEGTSFLSLEEVIGNCHSALLAGTQTISTTLAGCMLHLAEWHPDDNKKNINNSCPISTTKTAFREMVQETLRILPPVASLPRCPVYGDLPVPTTTTRTVNAPRVTSRVPQGGLLIVDVLSMAHAASSGDGVDDTWVFRPFRKKSCESTDTYNSSTTTHKVPPCYPWGIGDRICPAGNLSVSCISAVLEALVTQWSWRLSNPSQDSVGNTGTQGWIQAVSYEPSLTYPGPLYVELQRQS